MMRCALISVVLAMVIGGRRAEADDWVQILEGVREKVGRETLSFT